jgi:hypothetical protein
LLVLVGRDGTRSASRARTFKPAADLRPWPRSADLADLEGLDAAVRPAWKGALAVITSVAGDRSRKRKRLWPPP